MPTDPVDRIPGLLELVDLAVDNATLDDLYSALEQAITSSSRRIEDASANGDEWWQEAMKNHESDQIEQLLGLAFLAAQIFITTVRKRFDALSTACRAAGRKLNLGTNAEIKKINAVANYWKHHEEWPTRLEPQDNDEMRVVWDYEKMKDCQKRTAKIVESIGMSPSLTGHLFIAAEALGITEFEDLSPMRDELRDWAHRLLKKAKSKVVALEYDMAL